MQGFGFVFPWFRVSGFWVRGFRFGVDCLGFGAWCLSFGVSRFTLTISRPSEKSLSGTGASMKNAEMGRGLFGRY